MLVFSAIFDPPTCGNAVTANRIIENLEVLQVCQPVVRWGRRGESDGATVFVALHALKGTACLTDGGGRQCVEVPGRVRVLILGGTDVSDAEDDEEARAELVARLDVFHAIVAFTDHMAKRVSAWAPHVVSRLHVIPPAVPDRLIAMRTMPATDAARAWAAALPGLGTDQPFLALPTGLRPVKDPLFLLSAYAAWYRRQSGTVPRLLLFGVVRPDVPTSGSFAVAVADAVRDCDGVSLVPPISPSLFTEVLRLPTCRGLVNCSLSEGAANAVLEAMALGVPVLARRIPGNVALVGEAGEGGLLFDTPDEFLAQLEGLLSVDGDSPTAVAAARLIDARHRQAHEGRQYRSLVESLLHPDTAEDMVGVKEWWRK
jgi:glycosyltransferase involved in cell wall biosynthesis